MGKILVVVFNKAGEVRAIKETNLVDKWHVGDITYHTELAHIYVEEETQVRTILSIGRQIAENWDSEASKASKN